MAAMSTKVKRRLTTILCADVAGYARLMEADEVGTLAALRRHRDAMAMLIARHDGRIVNTWGDAVIAEFASVVEAVQCAVETQQELAGYNTALPDNRQMRFRIGINLGDVMAEGDDVYGDGVNVAARLQELAEPGGILISAPVYDQVHNKLSVRFDSIGQQRLKNVANLVTGYRVTQGRPAARSPKSQRDIGRSPAASRLSKAWSWYLSLPRAIGVILAISAFLALINLFTGPGEIWFHWPVVVLLLIVVLWRVLRRSAS